MARSGERRGRILENGLARPEARRQFSARGSPGIFSQRVPSSCETSAHARKGSAAPGQVEEGPVPHTPPFSSPSPPLCHTPRHEILAQGDSTLVMKMKASAHDRETAPLVADMGIILEQQGGSCTRSLGRRAEPGRDRAWCAPAPRRCLRGAAPWMHCGAPHPSFPGPQVTCSKFSPGKDPEALEPLPARDAPAIPFVGIFFPCLFSTSRQGCL